MEAEVAEGVRIIKRYRSAEAEELAWNGPQ